MFTPARATIKVPTPLHTTPAPTDAATSGFVSTSFFAPFGTHVSSPVRNRTVDVGEKLALRVCLRQVTLLMRADNEPGRFYDADRGKPGGGTERGDQIADRGWRHRAVALCRCFVDRGCHSSRLQRVAQLWEQSQSGRPGMDADHQLHCLWAAHARLRHWAPAGLSNGSESGLGTNAAWRIRCGPHRSWRLRDRSEPGLPAGHAYQRSPAASCNHPWLQCHHHL